MILTQMIQFIQFQNSLSERIGNVFNELINAAENENELANHTMMIYIVFAWADGILWVHFISIFDKKKYYTAIIQRAQEQSISAISVASRILPHSIESGSSECKILANDISFIDARYLRFQRNGSNR